MRMFPAAPSVRLPYSDLALVTCFTLGSSCCGHRLQVPQTSMAWRAVCTRPGNVFTAPWSWCAITSDSSFIESSCRLHSELRPAFEICITSLCSCPLYRPLYCVCGPRRKGRDDLTSSPTFLSTCVGSLTKSQQWWQLVTGLRSLQGNLTPQLTW